MTYKEIIKVLQHRSGLGKAEYANELGYSAGMVSKVLNDKHDGSLKLVEACLKQAGIDPQLCLELPEKHAESKGELRLLRAYRLCDERRRALLLDSAAEFAELSRLQKKDLSSQ